MGLKRKKLQQTSNIWAMISAASFAAAFFQGLWFWGFALGLFAFRMSMYLLEAAEKITEEHNGSHHRIHRNSGDHDSRELLHGMEE